MGGPGAASPHSVANLSSTSRSLSNSQGGSWSVVAFTGVVKGLVSDTSEYQQNILGLPERKTWLLPTDFEGQNIVLILGNIRPLSQSAIPVM